ncbi:hypothetical protein BD324DRAFT_617601 [Kockovaella imperatae]|uniref:Fe2OG dioxygenase domain-containing protein n=1 Tax=Kockovaella imperatae TaxID=4999 RepID=A0A1Y1ULK2_9TREE|nr:hypothetical protein BD324DRAFT_617601 [Kockovaella imperatae]ORX38862.1 hypothetical protein BD324DRAFT_617601 [Kockovaella imperatae]
MQGIESSAFFVNSRDQVMLFERKASEISSSGYKSASQLPVYLHELLGDLSHSLKPRLPAHVWTTVFRQDLARQVIINLYEPGQGITPHVDLINRYADGIVGVSLCGSASMTFEHIARPEERYHVFLPSRSVYVLRGSARYDYSHGIEGRALDLVNRGDGRIDTILRESRLSITFRWIKEGGDILD